MTAATNPWGLDEKQVQTLRVLAGPAKGVSKRACALLQREVKTIDKHVGRICRAMGAANRLEALLMFDRFERSREAAQDQAAKASDGVACCPNCNGLGFVTRRQG